MIFTLVLSAVSILPADALSMADSLFNRKQYALAVKEYDLLKDNKALKRDEVLFRLAESHKALSEHAKAREYYLDVVKANPSSRYRDKSLLNAALLAAGDESVPELRRLLGEEVENPVRAAAAYHLGSKTGDPEFFEKSIAFDPHGKYSRYAAFSKAQILLKSKDSKVRSKAVSDLLTIAFSKQNALSEDAFYLVAIESYNEENYQMASNMLRNYLKKYPDGKYAAAANKMRLWALFLTGRYSDCILLTEGDGSEDALYISEMSHYQAGNVEKSQELFSRYLDLYPNGKYLKQVQIPLIRMSFDAAVKSGDKKKAVESAARLYDISKSPSDAIRLAWAHEQDSSFDAASKIYYSIAASSPGTGEASEALFRKAMIDIRAERYSAAEVALSEAVKCDEERNDPQMASRMAEMNYWRGVCAVKTGHEKKALEFLSSALKGALPLDQNLEARILIADIEYNAGRYAEAKKRYGALVAEDAGKRMSAEKILHVARFLMEDKYSKPDVANAMLAAKCLEKAASGVQWKQQAKFVVGMVEERRGNSAAAIEAYKAGFAYPTRTELSKSAAFSLGSLLRKNCEADLADKYLSYAIELNADNPPLRAKAYLELAENSLQKRDAEKAKAYATVVVTLFDEPHLKARAEEILKTRQEQ